MTSQIILALRTYAVSRQSRPVLYTLIILFIRCCIPEFLSTFYKRIRSQTNVCCTSGNPPGVHIAALSYVGGLVFDVVTMGITSRYLWKFSSSSRSSFSQLTGMMLRDGLMYFVALSAMNVVNIIFFQNPQTVLQSSAVSLGFASTMIFSGRFILNLSEHVRDGLSGDQDQSSRARVPRTPMASGFRPQNTLNGAASEAPPLVISVVQNVITMSDMGKEDDGDLESGMKGRNQW
ncbi:hypothetical protein DFH08DRAFT_1089016 [Mycena albidolilacea]|uniref:Uncharacterized protein n=1 Tax=Mycena albidolilacea TaxID=1033008 RepID=A0AAD6Z2Z4_9AGAR|nr:hypothetical protein DFH08DRAFT_1089016 [Mycena albidolilacea]